MTRLSNMLGVRELSQDGNAMELPPATAFPKVVYRATSKAQKGYVTKLVHSQAEEDALPNGWLTTAAEIHGLLDPIHKAANLNPADDENFFDDAPKPAKTKAQPAAEAATTAPPKKAKKAKKPKAK